jgi:hypothetical protein
MITTFKLQQSLLTKRSLIVYLALIGVYFYKVYFECLACASGIPTWHAEGGRFFNDVNGLFNAWNATEETDELLHPWSLYFPFSPRGEKSVFIFSGAVVLELLSTFSTNQLEKPLLWLNVTSILAILFLIVKMQSRISLTSAFLSSLIILTTHDIWQLAIDGYHTIFSLVFLLAGILITRDLPSKARSFFCGVIWSMGIFASPHLVIPIFSIVLTRLILHFVKPTEKLASLFNYFLFMSLGALTIVMFSEIAYLFQPDWNGRSPLAQLLTEGRGAESWSAVLGGAEPPFYESFIFDYFSSQIGLPLFLLLGLGFLLSLIYPNKSLRLRLLPWACLIGIFIMYSLKLPQIGRPYIPLLVMFIVPASFGLAKLTEFFEGRERIVAIVTLVLFVAILANSNSRPFLNKDRDTPLADKQLEQSLTSYFEKPIIDTVNISNQFDKAFQQVQGKIVRINLRQRLGHHDYNNTRFELFAADLNELLKPIITTSAPPWEQRCFENEFQQAALCKNDLDLAYPYSSKLQQTFNPNRFYYFTDDLLIPALFEASLAEGILLAEQPNPILKSINGLSRHEAQGRWSDGKNVKFTFNHVLPTTFILELNLARAFGSNVGKALQVEAGDWKGTITSNTLPGLNKVLVNTRVATDTIIFTIPHPQSPHSLNDSADRRQLGYLFNAINIKKPNHFENILAEGIQFTSQLDPSRDPIIKSISGLSGYEAQGRWSDGKEVAFIFNHYLPTAFTLELNLARAFGSNIDKEILVQVGDWKGGISGTIMPEVNKVLVKTTSPTDTIKLTIPQPQSPHSLNGSEDRRQLGFLFSGLNIHKLDYFERTLAQGIQLATKPDPSKALIFKSINGLSGYEAQGRWSDGKEVTFTFNHYLPTAFTLELNLAGAEGANVGKELQVRAGDWRGVISGETIKPAKKNWKNNWKKALFGTATKPTINKVFVKTTSPTNTIVFTIPHPQSPHSLRGGEDRRQLGYMFERLTIIGSEKLL